MKAKRAMKSKRKQTKTKPKAHSQTTEHIATTVKAFRDARDWGQFHDAKNLAISLNVEAGELLELFLWKQPSEVDAQRLKEELADVFYVAFLLADAYQCDVGEIVAAKLKLNAAKYPVKKAKGSKKKYDEL
jgi:NTP pyrophosphatase (non-canonical NTP hydrolase)